jgi:tetratricopeptide (TPR) repeat protein
MISVTELDERIIKCREILDEDPNSQIFAALAETYRKKGELDKAFQICQNGLKLHSKYGAAHVVMAKINLDRGLYDWAEAEAQKAAEVEGRTRSIELLMAEISIYKGEFDAAIKILKSLQQFDPDNSQIQKLLEIAHKIPEEQTQIIKGNKLSKSLNDKKTTVIVNNNQDLIPEQVNLKSPDILEKAVSIPNVNGALFVNQEGLIIDFRWGMKLDQNICGAALVDMGHEMDEHLLNGSFGRMISVLIETKDLVYYIIRNSNGAFIFVASADVNLGSLRLNIDKLMKAYNA